MPSGCSHVGFVFVMDGKGASSPRATIVQLESVMETVNLSIQGMHCGGCATKVSTALNSIPGANVEDVAVGSARVSFDPKKTSAAALIGAVNGLGFKATKGAASGSPPRASSCCS
jgi:copper chaperone